METIAQYPAEDLPDHLLWQLRDFARIQWYQEITHDIKLQLHPEKWHPRYFVLVQDQILVSSATVLWKMIDFQGRSYKVYGLGMVLTYPEYRKKGYGRHVVSVATHFIKQDPTADLAILQTAPYLERFYAEHGWEHPPHVKVLNGSPENPVDDSGWIMAMFLSEDAQNNRKHFDETPFYLDTDIW